MLKLAASVSDQNSTLETMSKADAAKKRGGILKESQLFEDIFRESSIWSDLDDDYDSEWFKGSAFKRLDEKFDKLTDDFMEPNSPSKMLGSEILAAANRIIYRYFNDGDLVNKGYGKKTCSPAYRFLKETLDANADITISHYDTYEDFLKAIEYYVVWEFGRNPELSRTKNDKGSYLNY